MTEIIIADDHDIVREGIKAILQRDESYHIIDEALDGEEALEKIKEKNPDILLLDVSLPKISGLDIIERIHNISPKTKVIIITVHKSDYFLIEALQKGVKAYIHKSEVVEELLPALRKVEQDRIYVSSSLSSSFFEKFLWSGKKENSGRLTPRELEIMRLIARGKTSKEIAEILYISLRTVNNHRQNIFRKLGIHKSTDLIRYVIENKIIDLE